MSVPSAYLGIIVIWTTTPLAIQWSNQTGSFVFAAGARMALGALVAGSLLWLLRLPLPWHRPARHTYLAGVLGLYGALGSVYWAAQYIPSGLIAVIFGLAPIFTGTLESLILRQSGLSRKRLGGMLLGLAGLALVFWTGAPAGPLALAGIAAVAFSALLHSLSAVWIKHIGAELSPLSVTAGSLLLVTPLYGITWLATGGAWPEQQPAQALGAILYLGTVGSVFGFVLYFYVLQRIPAGRLALVTLITPITALVPGQALNGETISLRTWIGTAVISSGLAVYLWEGSQRAPQGQQA